MEKLPSPSLGQWWEAPALTCAVALLVLSELCSPSFIVLFLFKYPLVAARKTPIPTCLEKVHRAFGVTV